jgi:SAM-dependent methyltransferase
MKEFWNSRYQDEEYAYGIEPNTFFKSFIDANPPGKILLPAEGEGRNAVYAALKGWEVCAFDYSEQARSKALRLAREKEVQINYVVFDLMNLNMDNQTYDAIALTFVHLPSKIRRSVHRHLENLLKPGGKLILEAFSKEQLRKDSGGPRNEDMLYNMETLREDFRYLNIDNIEQLETELNEGKYHQGVASVIRLRATKTQPTISIRKH